VRIAIISDIHGNAVALHAVLHDLATRPTDRVICLGDALQGGAQPVEVCDILMNREWSVVLGNADDFILTGDTGPEDTTREQLEVRAWSLAQLTPAHRDFMATFEPTVRVELAGRCVLLCFHGSPKSFNDLILPWTQNSDIRHLLPDPLPHALAGGHTHLQQIRRIDDSVFVNPGTVGLAYEHGPGWVKAWAEYAVLTIEQQQIAVEFRRLPYSAQQYADSVLASGRPSAVRLATSFQPGMQAKA
jgi:predicted phosphodiesterase